MRLFVTGATRVMQKLAPGCKDVLGSFPTPASWASPTTINDLNLPIAMDNGCYNGLNEKRFLKMLHAFREAESSVDWVAVPDVLGDAERTCKFWDEWRPWVEGFGFTPSFVLQDGLSLSRLMELDPPAVFIGGSTKFKMGKEVRNMVRWARTLNRPVHMGRVSSRQRIRYAITIGCTSCDGSRFSKWSEQEIPKAVDWIRQKLYPLHEWYKKFGPCIIPQE